MIEGCCHESMSADFALIAKQCDLAAKQYGRAWTAHGQEDSQ